MKLLARTTNNTMVMSLMHEGSLEAGRPGVVVPHILITNKMTKGEIELIANLSDAATDVEFVNYLTESKGDEALAIASFVEDFGVGGKRADQKAPETINGSDHLPSVIDINGENVALGEIVRAAFTASGLSADDWNKMVGAEREKLLNAEIEKRKGTEPKTKTSKKK